MNKKIEELLTVLIEEEEQYGFLSSYFTEKYFNTNEWPYWYGVCDILIHGEHSEKEDILAILALKLRNDLHDVIGNAAWDRACWEVWRYEMRRQGSDIYKREDSSLTRKEMFCWSWMATWADPIHLIIAALITKIIIADPEEKFDAHLTEENTKKVICKRCGGVNKHKQVEDPMAGDSHMLTTMPCPFDDYIHPNRGLLKDTYAIAQDDEGDFDFWKGPSPSLQKMLNTIGRNNKSVIFRFNKDGTNDIICRWSSFADGWLEFDDEQEDG